MLAGNRVIITVAINGGMQQDPNGAVIPKQHRPNSAARCHAAGAAMVHVHARDPQDENSGDRNVDAQIIREIRARSPILIQTTNGVGVRHDPATGRFIWPTDSERFGLLNLEPQRDLFGIAAGSADFYNPEGGHPERDGPRCRLDCRAFLASGLQRWKRHAPVSGSERRGAASHARVPRTED